MVVGGGCIFVVIFVGRGCGVLCVFVMGVVVGLDIGIVGDGWVELVVVGVVDVLG